MEIFRQIGEVELLVESSESESIYLPSDIVAAQITDANANSPELTRRQILRLLANGDVYRPLSLTWEMLDRCNFSCPFCYIVGHSKEKIVRFSSVKPHLEDLVEAGLLYCTLTGGEVTIHPDFAEIYSFLKNRGVIVRVFTNGFQLSEELFALWQDLPPSEVQVSLYTLEDEKLSRIYGVKSEKGATTVLHNVLKLKSAGVNVTCKTFLNTITKPDAASIAEWCRQNDIEYFASAELTAAYDGEDISGFAVSAVAAPVQTDPFICLPCGTKNYGCALSPAFEIYPCPAINLRDCRYNVRELGIAESVSRMKAFMRKFQDTKIQGACVGGKCATCIAFATPVRDLAGNILHFAHT